MTWVGHILRKEDRFLARKMLVRMQKPYEDGPTLLDAPRSVPPLPRGRARLRFEAELLRTNKAPRRRRGTMRTRRRPCGCSQGTDRRLLCPYCAVNRP